MEQPKETERQTEILSPLLLDYADASTIDPSVNITSNIPIRITRRNNIRLASNRHMNFHFQRNFQESGTLRANSRNLVKIVPISSHQQSRNKRRNCLPNVLLFNARSICSQISEVEIAINMHKSDIVFVTETWLNHNISDELVQISNFNLLRSDRTSGRGGGVALYIQENIP